MTTLLQIEANRRNALRSTGARTETGRTTARRNTLRHGPPPAEKVILFDQRQEEFERFYAEIVAALKPEGLIEAQLAERSAINAWRIAVPTGSRAASSKGALVLARERNRTDLRHRSGLLAPQYQHR